MADTAMRLVTLLATMCALLMLAGWLLQCLQWASATVFSSLVYLCARVLYGIVIGWRLVRAKSKALLLAAWRAGVQGLCVQGSRLWTQMQRKAPAPDRAARREPRLEEPPTEQNDEE